MDPTIKEMIYSRGHHSASQVAKILGVSTRTVRRWRELGIGPRWVSVGPMLRMVTCDALAEWYVSQADER